MQNKREPQKVTVIRQCLVSGRVVEPGKSWEASWAEAKALIESGKARPADKLSAEDKALIAAHEARLKRGGGAVVAAPAALAPASAAKSQADLSDSPELPKPEEMTRDQLMGELDRLKISYARRDTRDELLLKLTQALEE